MVNQRLESLSSSVSLTLYSAGVAAVFAWKCCFSKKRWEGFSETPRFLSIDCPVAGGLMIAKISISVYAQLASRAKSLRTRETFS